MNWNHQQLVEFTGETGAEAQRDFLARLGIPCHIRRAKTAQQRDKVIVLHDVAVSVLVKRAEQPAVASGPNMGAI